MQQQADLGQAVAARAKDSLLAGQDLAADRPRPPEVARLTGLRRERTYGVTAECCWSVALHADTGAASSCDTILMTSPSRHNLCRPLAAVPLSVGLPELWEFLPQLHKMDTTSTPTPKNSRGKHCRGERLGGDAAATSAHLLPQRITRHKTLPGLFASQQFMHTGLQQEARCVFAPELAAA
ncbi:hypothetical protein E2C01_054814 [Portunus trituberculatus]|uniref:Uncharacterized protein n=1 Tax=Portunus trituberculatus TaxID=210409 RepID=A0A5B7GUA4_PORTR|nr:hypothetical protein [Portunus trituberculatus]